MTKIDSTKNAKFAMAATEDVLEFLDLKLTFDKECKRISVNIFAKATNSSTYVLPSTCFTKIHTENFSNTKLHLHLITQYNPLHTYIKTIIKEHLSVLYSSHKML